MTKSAVYSPVVTRGCCGNRRRNMWMGGGNRARCQFLDRRRPAAETSPGVSPAQRLTADSTRYLISSSLGGGKRPTKSGQHRHRRQLALVNRLPPRHSASIAPAHLHPPIAISTLISSHPDARCQQTRYSCVASFRVCDGWDGMYASPVHPHTYV
jgi:hypothetical protein